MKNVTYNRILACEYAKKWALKRNQFLINFRYKTKNLNQIYIASHTYHSYYKPIAEYNYSKIRFVHIENVRKW